MLIVMMMVVVMSNEDKEGDDVSGVDGDIDDGDDGRR